MPTIRSVAALVRVFLCLAGPAGASGQLDPTFGDGGFVTTEFHHASNEIHGIALQADGKFLATGRTTGQLIGLWPWHGSRRTATSTRVLEPMGS